MGTEDLHSAAPARRRRWRTVDIVVASVIAVAGGVVFWAWDQLWYLTDVVFAGFPPAHAVIYGVWLAPGVLGALVIRKPGAALYTELIASIVEAFLGSSWGLSVVVYGVFQGLGAELVFLVLAYRVWRLPVAVVSGALAGLAAASMDLVYYYGAWRPDWQLTYVVVVMISSAVLAGIGSWALVRALARTGVLSPFTSGRREPAV